MQLHDFLPNTIKTLIKYDIDNLNRYNRRIHFDNIVILCYAVAEHVTEQLHQN